MNIGESVDSLCRDGAGQFLISAHFRLSRLHVQSSKFIYDTGGGGGGGPQGYGQHACTNSTQNTH